MTIPNHNVVIDPVQSTHTPRKGWLQRVGIKVLGLLLFSLVVGVVVAQFSDPLSYEDRLMDIALQNSVSPQVYAQVQTLHEPGQRSAVTAVLLDYAYDSEGAGFELLAKAQIGLQKYGQDAADVLVQFGAEQAFQDALRNYGEGIIPVVAYFMREELPSVYAQYLLVRTVDDAVAVFRKMMGNLPWFLSEKPATAEPDLSGDGAQIAPYDALWRGQHALAKINHNGHQFLLQFTLDKDQRAHWLLTERGLEGLKAIFFSEIINLEKKQRQGVVLTLPDYGWAGLDLLGVVGVVKVLKLVKVKPLKEIGHTQRAAVLGTPVLRQSALGRRMMTWGAAAAGTYVLVRHPGLLSHVFAGVAQWFGWPASLGVALGWGSVVFIALLLVGWVVRPGLWVLGLILATGAKSVRWGLARV